MHRQQSGRARATRETLYQLGNSLEAANDGTLDLMKATADLAFAPSGEAWKWLLTQGASTREVNGTTIATGGMASAVARGIGFLGELAQGRSVSDAAERSATNAVTLGSGLIVSATEIEACGRHEAHELGHVEQAKHFGPFYLLAYLATITGSHDSHPAEINANRQAGLNSDGSAPKGWKNPWVGCK